jgi:hypothetical protein
MLLLANGNIKTAASGGGPSFQRWAPYPISNGTSIGPSAYFTVAGIIESTSRSFPIILKRVVPTLS